ncbi:acyl carrier protein [Nocardia panacis]|uniref:Acyl carrier protein n=1 Tax=Nocardia panacis TaxID=2340916 RepID=A0A3A4KYM1_9NOCA|nr:acyl carrier protein [Nocardia panacis]RJO78949.1 acyl carrier protein [Nocardia panacis]
MVILATSDRQLIKDVVCNVLEIETDEVTDTSLFIEDHEADSMRLIEILSALELSLELTIEQTNLPRMVNLVGIYDVIAELKE